MYYPLLIDGALNFVEFDPMMIIIQIILTANNQSAWTQYSSNPAGPDRIL